MTLGCRASAGVDRSGAGRGLVGEHVDAGSHAGRVECGDQGFLVDDLAAGGVDEHGVGLHGGQEPGIDHSRGVVAAGYVQRHDVAGGQHRGPVGQSLYADAGHALAHGPVPRFVLGDDPETAGRGPLRHLQADGAHADDAERRSVQAPGLAVGLLVPLSRPHIGGGGGDVAVDGEHQAQRQLGYRDGVAAGNVAHVHAQLRSPGAVDRVGAGTGSHDQSQLVAGLDGRCCDSGAAHHQHVEAGNVVGKVFGGQGGLQRAGVAAAAQPFYCGVGQAVGEQDSHAATTSAFKSGDSNACGTEIGTVPYAGTLIVGRRGLACLRGRLKDPTVLPPVQEER